LGGGSVGATGAGGATVTAASAFEASTVGSYVIRTSAPTPVPIVEMRTLSLKPTASPCGFAASVTLRMAKLAVLRSMMSSEEAS
jgi:hypothetical protein